MLNWFFTLTLSMAYPIIFASIGIFLTFYLKDSLPPAFTFIAAALISIGLLYLPVHFQPIPPKQEDTLRLFAFNAKVTNNKIEDILPTLRASNADIILITETRKRWRDLLPGLADIYPYTRHIYAAERPIENRYIDRFLILSKVPFEVQGMPFINFINIKFNLPSGPLTLIASHPMAPMNERFLKQRNDGLAAIPANQSRTIVAGDFNTVPWDPPFQKMLKTTGLKMAWPPYATYPANSLPLPPLIPIDHILTTPDLTATRLTPVPIPGSDHIGILSDISFEK